MRELIERFFKTKILKKIVDYISKSNRSVRVIGDDPPGAFAFIKLNATSKKSAVSLHQEETAFFHSTKIDIHHPISVFINDFCHRYAILLFLMINIHFIDRPRCRSPPLQSVFHTKKLIGGKAVFDNTNPYTLRTKIIQGITHYFVSFTDGQAILRETEVSRPVYLEFLRFTKAERNLRRWDERHMEQSDLTEETICERVLYPPDNVEDTVFDSLLNKELQTAIQSLPIVQRRRFVLYHEFGLTYEQIAKMEGCTKMPIKRSVVRAKEKIREKIKKFKK